MASRRYPPGDEAVTPVEELREMGRLLCRCPGLIRRDPDCLYQCRVCKRRIHRSRDPFIHDDVARLAKVIEFAERDRFHTALRRAHARINPPSQEDS